LSNDPASACTTLPGTEPGLTRGNVAGPILDRDIRRATAVQHSFGKTSDFTLGVEEELLVIEDGSLGLAHKSDELLAAMALDERFARHDLYEAQIELSSSICRSAGESVRELADLRSAARAAGGRMIGAGIHPTGAFGDTRMVRAKRYEREAQNLRGLVRRTPDCALHVHVGMPDPETAIRVCNGFRPWIPVLEALAANSPFWHGIDSGFASARRVLRRSFPRVGIPRPFQSFDQYVEIVASLMDMGELEEYTFIWWEVRPHPKFGTVEVRAMDSQSSLANVAGIAALVQALAKHLAESPPAEHLAGEVIEESSFRAGRDGIDAAIGHGASIRPVREMAAEAVRLARPHARELGSEEPLLEVQRILSEGNGADRQRAAHERGGMKALLEGLAGETSSGWDERSAARVSLNG
jgi:carboxylate-amine ligase